ncbi:MAG: tRNA lysidine(34) synthetase TilS, partial [Candidatus Eisenbacteria bacterium]|nr:tRNA lysidine(34) synthetase TilS [Candidatus Eisenbacteria bacterium]
MAVSGGADSTALLVALASLAGELELTLAAAHLHHGLRGADADADLELARSHARLLGVPLVSARVDARAAMKREGLSGEAGLRTLRRRFLLAAADRAGCAWIATAHTADDQLETLLMRLARGSGLAGLGGMRARRGPWLKPLLAATRADVERDLVRAGLGWREDASNASREHLRN